MALNHKNNLSVFYAHVLYSSLQIGESIQFGVNVFFVYFCVRKSHRTNARIALFVISLVALQRGHFAGCCDCIASVVVVVLLCCL